MLAHLSGLPNRERLGTRSPGVSGAAYGFLTATTLLLPFRELLFRFLQLLLEGRIGMQRGDDRRPDDTRRIYVALPVIAADHPALAELKAALKDFILPLGINLSQHQSGGPADRGVAGGVGAVFDSVSCSLVLQVATP